MRIKMSKTIKLSLKEEVINSLSHGIMAIISLAAIPIVAIYSYFQGGQIHAFANSIYIICMFLMFLNSTLYHTMPYDTSYKLIFRILDHSFIYFAIAGAYTPVALGIIQGKAGIAIVIIQWSIVIFGVLYKIFAKTINPRISLAIYLIMGWTIVFFLPRLIRNASPRFLIYLLVGGLLYSVGAYFYAKKKLKFSYVIWHIFIVLASISHFIAIVFHIH